MSLVKIPIRITHNVSLNNLHACIFRPCIYRPVVNELAESFYEAIKLLKNHPTIHASYDKYILQYFSTDVYL